MANEVFNVLFLCTGNSARSIMAEGLLNHWGEGQFRAYSAGSFPTGKLHPMALALLQQDAIPTENLRSKAWDEFAAPGAPTMDFVITVCDDAAGEVCPIWPGQPMTAHWGISDPAAVEGTEAEQRHAFFNAFNELNQRIRIFTNLPIQSLDRIKLHEHLDSIGSGAETMNIA
jgi:arsenate reductase (thioredoxin)